MPVSIDMSNDFDKVPLTESQYLCKMLYISCTTRCAELVKNFDILYFLKKNKREKKSKNSSATSTINTLTGGLAEVPRILDKVLEER